MGQRNIEDATAVATDKAPDVNSGRLKGTLLADRNVFNPDHETARTHELTSRELGEEAVGVVDKAIQPWEVPVSVAELPPLDKSFAVGSERLNQDERRRLLFAPPNTKGQEVKEKDYDFSGLLSGEEAQELEAVAQMGREYTKRRMPV